MTIINPNSISGISSITALNSTAAINLFKADGTAANIIAKVTSVADKGASNVSIILPCIFPIIKEETECEKLC